MHRRLITHRQRAVEIARVLRLEIQAITEFDQAARRDMVETLDDLIAALSFAEAA